MQSQAFLGRGVSRILSWVFVGLCALPAGCGGDDGEAAEEVESGAEDDDSAADDDAADDDAADDDAADDDAADDDAPAADDSAGDSDDDAADDDADVSDDAAGSDDDVSDDDNGSSTSFETDAGTVEVIFGGEGPMCGEEECLDGTLLQEGEELFSLMGCCADESESTCGLDMSALGILIGLRNPGCEPLGLAGTLSTECPDSDPLQAALESANGVVLPGCCQAGGQCGYMASFEGLGFGCMSPTRFGADEGADCTP